MSIWKVQFNNHTAEIFKDNTHYHFYFDGEWNVSDRIGKFQNDEDAIETWRKICAFPKNYVNLVIK